MYRRWNNQQIGWLWKNIVNLGDDVIDDYGDEAEYDLSKGSCFNIFSDVLDDDQCKNPKKMQHFNVV